MKSSREYELEIEKLKRLIKRKDLKIADLETEKKTLKLKFKIQSEELGDLKKTNKTVYYRNKYRLEKETVTKLKEELNNANACIANMRAKLNKDSSNSSKPSSSDGLKKVTHSLREKTGKSIGGQIGHKPHKLEPLKKVDTIVKIKKHHKCSCGGKIVHEEVAIKRQVVDIEIKYIVTQYEGNNGRCEQCGKIHKVKFPEGVENEVQYGDSVKAFSSTLNNYCNVSINKVAKVIGVFTNTKEPSKGSIVKWTKSVNKKIEPVLSKIKEAILNEPLINYDETPINVDGNKYNYVLGAFTKKYALLECYKNRSNESFKEMNILPRYFGIVAHDHYASYHSFKGYINCECNAHPIRKMKSIIEIHKREECKKMMEFLYQIKKEVENTCENRLEEERLKQVYSEYLEILDKWNTKYLEDSKRKEGRIF